MDICFNFNDSRINFSNCNLFTRSKRTGLFKYYCKQIFTNIHMREYFGFNVLVMGLHDFIVRKW